MTHRTLPCWQLLSPHCFQTQQHHDTFAVTIDADGSLGTKPAPREPLVRIPAIVASSSYPSTSYHAASAPKERSLPLPAIVSISSFLYRIPYPTSVTITTRTSPYHVPTLPTQRAGRLVYSILRPSSRLHLHPTSQPSDHLLHVHSKSGRRAISIPRSRRHRHTSLPSQRLSTSAHTPCCFPMVSHNHRAAVSSTRHRIPAIVAICSPTAHSNHIPSRFPATARTQKSRRQAVSSIQHRILAVITTYIPTSCSSDYR